MEINCQLCFVGYQCNKLGGGGGNDQSGDCCKMIEQDSKAPTCYSRVVSVLGQYFRKLKRLEKTIPENLLSEVFVNDIRRCGLSICLF